MQVRNISFLLRLAVINHRALHSVSLLCAKAKSVFITIYIVGVHWLMALSAASNLVCAAISSLRVA